MKHKRKDYKDVLNAYRAPGGGLKAVETMVKDEAVSKQVLRVLAAHMREAGFHRSEKELVDYAEEHSRNPGRPRPNLGEPTELTATGRKGSEVASLRLPLYYMHVKPGKPVRVTFEKPGRIVVESMQ